MKYIELLHGLRTLVDDRDFRSLSSHKWYVSRNGYVYRPTERHENGKAIKSADYLHRVVMGAPSGMVVDHINGNKLDNRKSNLKVVTQSENNMNAKMTSRNTSGIRGVSWSKHYQRWVPRIAVRGKEIYLGRYKTKEEAARVYEQASREYHGEYSFRGNRA